ncbi:hypothetical protein OC846_003206 [Tilletia horrida]|uniref:CBM21 domain-containing protein n=1 Tax=Tilletia horrida TaxID=155126 RepID=A0AAN6JS85_9BASI|nr:hypothetical protein OC846_003206 [Tilletia horrida]
MLVSSNHNHHHQHHHASSPYSQMHGFEAGASSSASGSSHIPTSNGRSRGHAHSASSDAGQRPRSASSSESTASSRSGPHVIRSQHASSSKGSPSSSQDSLLTDEQRLTVLRQQQAQRRPKMLRLTPAINSLTGASRSLSATMAPLASPLDSRQGESSRPASVVGITSLTGDFSSSSLRQSILPGADVDSPPTAALTILIDPKKVALNGQGEDSKVLFPVVGSPPNSYHAPLHPGSRKALAQKATLQPANGAALQLDLGCITGPSMSDHSSAASANSAATLPELVRKKSGEPVKSSLKHFTQSAFLHRSDSSPAAPASFRAKSVPNTPTASKAVHFDPVLEHIKVFKHKQRPTAVSRDGSPEHTETETEEEREFPFYQNWRKHAATVSSPGGASNGSAASTPTGDIGAAEQLVLRLPNFPSSAKMSVDRKVFLERAYLSDDLRSVKGTVQVQNLAFEKWVAIRFTLDNWATVCEVSAEHSESIKGGKSDRFTFSIKLNELLIWTRGQSETKTMFLCIRFTAAGQEFWDNNEDNNYQLDFRKRPALETVASSSKSRAESPSSVGRSHSRKVHSPNSTSAEFNSSRKVHSPKNFQIEELGRSLERLRSDEDAELGDERAPLPVRSKRRSPPASPGSVNGRSSSPSMWTARYDFDLSLKNPKTGSRTTNAGRQAALDYFSAKPPPPSTALGRPIFIGSSPQVSPAYVEGDVFSPSLDSQGSITPVALRSTDSALAVPVGVFAPKVGMISPGLGDVIAHLPTSVNTGSATPSPSSGFNSAANSPAAELSTDVVEMGTVEQPAVVAVVTRSTPEARTSASTKFHSYPVNRHTLSPMAGAQLYRNPRVLEERVPSPLSRQSTATSNSGRESPVKKDRSNGVLLTSSFVGDSPQHSPVSPLHSPNPFSPSLSVSSLESDNTTCLASPEDTVLGSSLGSSRRSTDIRTPGSVEDIHRSLLNMGRVGLPNGNGAPSTPEGNSSQATPGSPTLSTASTSDSASSSSSMKPGSVSSYDELIARFCWNDSSNSQGDTTVTSATASSGVPEPSTALPSNGHASSPTSMNLQRLPHRAFANTMGSPTTESGSTTPTIGF